MIFVEINDRTFDFTDMWRGHYFFCLYRIILPWYLEVKDQYLEKISPSGYITLGIITASWRTTFKNTF